MSVWISGHETGGAEELVLVRVGAGGVAGGGLGDPRECFGSSEERFLGGMNGQHDGVVDVAVVKAASNNDTHVRPVGIESGDPCSLVWASQPGPPM